MSRGRVLAALAAIHPMALEGLFAQPALAFEPMKHRSPGTRQRKRRQRDRRSGRVSGRRRGGR